MLSPKRTKFRKQFKGRINGAAKAGTSLNFGAFGLKAMEPERLNAREIEAARRAITRQMKRAGRVWIRIFPDVPVSKKPAEVRMGSGKGAPEFWVAKVKPHPVRDRRRRPQDRQGSDASGPGETVDRDEVRHAYRPVRNRKMAKKAPAKKPAKKTTAAKASSKTEDFRIKNADELNTQLSNLKKEQFNLRFQRANGQVENTGRIRVLRRDIARIQTVLTEQRRAAQAKG